MWSVVEKTALAEAEVEYEDYTSDTVWVKFPIVMFPSRVRRSSERRQILGTDLVNSFSCNLDDHSLDLPGNRAISLFSKNRIRTLYEVDGCA